RRPTGQGSLANSWQSQFTNAGQRRPLAVVLGGIDNTRMDLPRNLKTETVSRLHPSQPWLVQAGQPVADAVKLMREKRVGCVLVCEQRRIVGIFTERDLLRRVLSQGLALDMPMLDCMTPDPITVHPKDSI